MYLCVPAFHMFNQSHSILGQSVYFDWFNVWKAGAQTKKNLNGLALVSQKNQKNNNFRANLVILDIVVGAARTKREIENHCYCMYVQALSTLKGV